MNRYIDAEKLKDFFYSESSGTEDTIYDYIVEAGLEDYLDEAKELCKKMIEAFKNIIDTEDDVDANNQWISVDAELPDDNVKVLTTDAFGNMHINRTSKILNIAGMPFGIDENHPRFYMVTHWRPLPGPPKEDKQ